jgi:DNA-binding MarR family transcriptional regulator
MQLHRHRPQETFLVKVDAVAFKWYRIRMKEPDRPTQAAWALLMRTSRGLLEDIEAALKAAGLPPLAWYDVLLEIEKAGNEGMRPFELKNRLLLPQYGTSRLLDRMVTAGLVDRQDCEDDGRGQIVSISDRGRETRASMWPVYGKVLATRIGAKLTPEEAIQLARLLSKI